MSYKNKIHPFRFLKSIKTIFLIAGCMTTVSVGLMILVFALQNNLGTQSIKAIVNNAVIVFPIGLFVLSLIAVILTSIRFSKKSIYLNNFSSIEHLSNLDMLCVDKLGAITDGALTIKNVIPLKVVATEQYIAQWVSNILRATGDHNYIADALFKKYDLELSAGVLETLPYNDTNRYFGASFKGGKTFIIGTPEVLNIKNKAGIIKRCEEEVKNGHTVLVIGEGKEQIQGDKYTEDLEPLALIILKEHVREKAAETFKWFEKNNIDIKVISSDNALSTSVIAAEAGIDDANNYISLEGMSQGEIIKAASQYTIFGQANAGQKRVLIDALKNNDHTIMMIGDMCNDGSALKRAHCSATVALNKEDTALDSDIVLEGSAFVELPNFIDESKSIVNKLTKISSLFIIKSIFAFALSLIFALASIFLKDTSICFPFTFNHFLPWDIVTSGIAALFLLLEKNNEKSSGSFLVNTFKKAIPGAILLIVSILLIFVFCVSQNNGLLNIGIYSFDTAIAMSIITFNVLGIVCLYGICLPLKKYRIILLASTTAGVAVLLAFSGIITKIIEKTEPFIAIPYLEMNEPAFISTLILIVALAATYIFILHIIEIEKGDNLDNEN